MTHNTPAPAPASHTPGPWHKHAEYIYAGTMQGELIAQVYDCASINREFAESAKAIDLDSSQANACLIASAPELLEALESVLASVPFPSYRGDGELEECEERVRQAIKKARGQRS